MTTIDTNMSLVMIDPNEPLELYDGTIIKGRLEWFLYAICCLDYGNLPTPLSRIEEWANALITNELPNMEPQSRAEEFFKAILTGDTSSLPTPQSRSEVLLDKLARGENDFTNVEKIQSRYEFLLAYLIKNGGGIGNIDYVLYKFQKEDETLYSTKQRPVKSAILKGQTLVNLVTYNKTNLSTSKWNHFVEFSDLKCDLKSSTKYLLIFNITNYNMDNTFEIYMNDTSEHTCFKGLALIINGNGVYKVVRETKDDLSKIKRVLFASHNPETTSGTYDMKIMIIEYQEGMENWDIPYFEGTQSVKMPVLTTTGKNLFSINQHFQTGNIAGSDSAVEGNYIGGNWQVSDFIKLNKNTVHYLSTKNFKFEKISYYDSNKKVIKGTAQTDCKEQLIESSNNDRYIRVVITKGNNESLTYDELLANNDIQLEVGTQATPYEPYKSNILSTPEDLELRGIGDVKDELDCLTGEVVENTIKLTFSGIENWEASTNLTNYMTFRLVKPSNMITADSHSNASKYVCDKLQIVSSNTVGSTEIEAIWFSSGHMYIRLPKTKASSLEEFKTYLSTNNIQVVSCTKQPVVKTVDLSIVDQGGATIPKLNTFDKITHVNVSATDILPGVEMEVATTVGEDLSGTLYSTMEDIETKQEALKESNNAKTESTNSTMMATTEIYESLL